MGRWEIGLIGNSDIRIGMPSQENLFFTATDVQITDWKGRLAPDWYESEEYEGSWTKSPTV